MVIQQNINLAADLTLVPKSDFDFQLACKIVAVFVSLLVFVSVVTGLLLSYNLAKENKLKREHMRHIKVLSDYENNYYVVDQAKGAGQLAGGSGERIGRVYYVLRSLARYKLSGTKLDRILISQSGAELSGVAEGVDVALRLVTLLKEHLGSVINFDRSDVRQRDDGMVDFLLTTDTKPADSKVSGSVSSKAYAVGG